MHFAVREIAVSLSAAALIVFCSCEKHHLGEDPEVQKEHVDVAAPSEENPGATKEASTSPTTTASPTPAEFFPESTPTP